jgi:NNP family nitrate/nitrite transporter-like MFS transporter
MTRGFLRAGHLPTLIASFLYFDVSFMIWVILGPLGPFIGEELHLTGSQKGLLIATPLLAGSIFRPLLGTLADAIGGRSAGMLGLSLSLIPLLAGWQAGTSLAVLYAAAVLLGIAGASFAVALPLASRWYPAEYQGLAMGIAGAGNSGTLIATLFAPRIAQMYGWHAAMGLAAIPVACVLILFAILARESPAARTRVGWSAYRTVVAQADTSSFCFLYGITFGGFVGLASFLTVFFYDQYGLSKVQAGDFTTAVVLFGSFLRPVGGWLADRFGGYRLLLGVLVAAALGIIGVATLPAPAVALALLAIVMAMFGMGNGAIFQMVPQRFPQAVGIITGLVGAAGGLGGFFLPSVLGLLKDRTGSYATGLAGFAAVVLVGCLALALLGRRWTRSWPESLVNNAGVFACGAGFSLRAASVPFFRPGRGGPPQIES